MSLPPFRPAEIYPGPTKGNQPRVWGYAVEHAVDRLAVGRPIRLTPQQRLTREEEAALSKRMWLRPETVQDAIRWSLRRGLLIVRRDEAGDFAIPDLDALRHRLRNLQRLGEAGAGPPEPAELQYFRGQRFRVHESWLAFVLGEREDFEP